MGCENKRTNATPRRRSWKRGKTLSFLVSGFVWRPRPRPHRKVALSVFGNAAFPKFLIESLILTMEVTFKGTRRVAPPSFKKHFKQNG